MDAGTSAHALDFAADLELSGPHAVALAPAAATPAAAPDTTHSAVSTFFATEAACSSAERVTIVGSITPASTRSQYSPVAASRPSRGPDARTRETTTEGSAPAFRAIWRSGSSSAWR